MIHDLLGSKICQTLIHQILIPLLIHQTLVPPNFRCLQHPIVTVVSTACTIIVVKNFGEWVKQQIDKFKFWQISEIVCYN